MLNNPNTTYNVPDTTQLPIRTFQTKQGILKLKKYGDALISSSEDNRLRCWKMDTRTGDLQLVKTFKGHNKGPAQKMSFYQNLMFTCSPRDNSMISWDLMAQEKLLDFQGHNKPLTCIAIDAKAPVVFTSSYDTLIKAYDVKSGTCMQDLTGHTDTVMCVKVYGNYLVSSSADSTLRVWDRRKLSTQVYLLKGHQGPVMGHHMNDKTIYSYSLDGSIQLWKLKTGECKLKMDLGYQIYQTKMLKKYILAMGNRVAFVEAYNLKGKKIATYEDNGAKVLWGKFYDQYYIFSSLDDRTVRLWTVKKAQQVSIYRGHTNTVNSLVCWQEWIYTGSSDGAIKQWTNPVSLGNQDNNEMIF